MADWDSLQQARPSESAINHGTDKNESDQGCLSPTIDRGKQTLFINAAFMDGMNKLTNKPWVLDLELSRSC